MVFTHRDKHYEIIRLQQYPRVITAGSEFYIEVRVF